MIHGELSRKQIFLSIVNIPRKKFKYFSPFPGKLMRMNNRTSPTQHFIRYNIQAINYMFQVKFSICINILSLELMASVDANLDIVQSSLSVNVTALSRQSIGGNQAALMR